MKLPYIQKFSGYSRLKVADSNRKEMLSVLEEILKFSIQLSVSTVEDGQKKKEI